MSIDVGEMAPDLLSARQPTLDERLANLLNGGSLQLVACRSAHREVRVRLHVDEPRFAEHSRSSSSKTEIDAPLAQK